jgi:metal-responsive CopG/Arc/MetJ family transcriptional regulator
MYSPRMGRSTSVRQSVSLPAPVAKRVRALAKTRKTSASRVLVDLIETGLQAKEDERQRFLELARRFKETPDPRESDRLREELAELVFGE